MVFFIFQNQKLTKKKSPSGNLKTLIDINGLHIIQSNKNKSKAGNFKIKFVVRMNKNVF